MLQDGTNTYVYGLDLISATDGAGVQTYFSYDGLGSTSDLTHGSGNSVAAYGYDVFGALRLQSGSSDNYWLFTGEQLDADSDMYYLRARYYDPETGRFLSQDPLPLGNLYAYVGNNPVNRVDPSGLMHIADVGGVRPKEGGGFDFDRLCPNRDPNRIYIIDDGVCYDITPDPCAGVNPLLCGSGESGLFGFQPEKLLNDIAKSGCDKFWDAGEYYNTWMTNQGEKVNELHARYHEWLDDPCTQAKMNLAATLLSTAAQAGFVSSVAAPAWLEGASSVHGGVTLVEATQDYKRACGG